jgi:hypothetical protein
MSPSLKRSTGKPFALASVHRVTNPPEAITMSFTSKLLCAVMLATLPACDGSDFPPPRWADGRRKLPDLWWTQQDFEVRLLPDAGAPSGVDAQPPIEQTPPVPGTSCSGNLTAEGTRWVKKGAGSQGIYSAPKTASASPSTVGTVPEGGAMKYFPTASQPGWACVLYGGAAGYIDASNLTTVPPAGLACKPGLKLSGCRWVKAGTGALNLRSVPSADAGNATVIAVIPEGASYKAAYYPDGDEPGWACLEYAGKTGYASAKYLAIAPPASSGSPGPGTTDPGSAFCTANPEVTWCGPLTKPCGWRSTKAECESVHLSGKPWRSSPTPSP